MESPTLYTLDILEYPGVSMGKGSHLFRNNNRLPVEYFFVEVQDIHFN
jgi:hypothetical protein